MLKSNIIYSAYPGLRIFLPGFLALALLLSIASCRTLDNSSPKETGPASKGTVALPASLTGKTDFRLPAKAALCGENIPLERPSVRERLEYEYLLAVNHPAQVELWRRRARRFFPLIEAALREAGLPDDLKYLAVAESDLRPAVESPAGAKGLWQFIPSTARIFGLSVSSKEDQRLLPELLLKAGTGYLTRLRGMFGNWALAMAAYNSGENRISRSISAQGTSDYYLLDLPTETERYVYRIAAIKIVLEGASLYGFNDQPPRGLYAPLKFQETTLALKEAATWPELAKRYKSDYKTLKTLNPHLAHRKKLEGGTYIFRLPPSSPLNVAS
jgi:hypothetical protein